MEIKEFENFLTKENQYNIHVGYEDEIDPYEIAECFKKQYPKLKAVISFATIKEIEFGMIIVGLNLKKGMTLANGRR